MLSVILIILKIIGITILILLGLILVILLVVLFVPIRYRVKVEHGDAFVMEGCVSWLLHFIHARIQQSDKKRRIWIRVFGFLVYDSLRPPKPKKEKSRRKTKARHKGHKRKLKSSNKVEKINKTEELKKIESDVISEADMSYKDARRKDLSQEKQQSKDKDQEDIHSEETENDGLESDGKILRFYNRIKEKILGFFRGIKNKIKDLMQKLISIKHKGTLIFDFIKDDINKEGFRYTYKSLIKLLKHILPRKLKSKLVFGTGDPCSTGQALGVFSILYSIYGDKLQITPDFENKVFKGNHYAKGRIRIWTILIISIKLLLDKRFKELKVNFQLLKEAL